MSEIPSYSRDKAQKASYILFPMYPFAKMAMNKREKATEAEFEKIIEAIRKSPNIKQTKLAEIIGKSNRTVARVIENSPRIRRVGSNRTGHWEIIEDKKED